MNRRHFLHSISHPPFYPYASDYPGAQQIYILQRMQQKFQDPAEAAPVTYQVLKALLIHSIPGISGYHGALTLITRAIGLTKENLTFIFKIIVISTLYIRIYLLPSGWIGSSFLGARSSPGQTMPGSPRPRHHGVGLSAIR